ncbi:amino acid adenylation domain-containing protein [Synoicihabitans lomoniglobus]|uniref:Amino acid adenylation domain-containing protein n=1 Tax=Synoicihabitans lomoniglobus TaxID=2909285 RepID=A0AAF0CP97_9BACT|nr:amino acid adenylation domain-containing protein [Opitutaceae bacterium LMO-M01]WED65705.1 amino acid adenylation domain-containing protein [Opitutaceae bacterium LMO-M01]
MDADSIPSASSDDAFDQVDDELLAMLLDEEGDAVAESPRSIPVRPSGAEPVLSFAQQRLWFLQQLEPTSPAYNISVVVKLGRAVAVEQLATALATIVKRHDVLRTAFPAIDGRAHVRRHDEARVAIEIIDTSPGELMSAAAEVSLRPFDLAQAPLLRLALLRTGSNEQHVVLVMHHIISDAWSMDNLVRELGLIYGAASKGAAPALPSLPIQYGDFAAWQRERLDAGLRDLQLAYWRQQLADPTELELPCDRPRPVRPDYTGASIPFTVSPDVVVKLRQLIADTESTFFMAMLAVGHGWLHRLSGQNDVVLGAPVANRGMAALEPLIGFFVNTLALRSRVDAETATFRTLLNAARQATLDGFAHQDVPFEAIVAELLPDRDVTRNPLFQVMLTADSAGPDHPAPPELGLEAIELPAAVAKFDLTLSLQESGAGISGALEYATALFDAATAERFVAQFQFSLEQFVASPDRPLAQLPRLPPAEAQQLLAWGAGPCPDYPSTSLAAVFNATAQRFPTSAALTFGDQSISYRELARRSHQLAHVLRSRGVQVDQPVGVCQERSPELVVTLLAILQAGGAYLALDPAYPTERITALLAAADCSIVVIDPVHREQMPSDVDIICPTEISAEIDSAPAQPPEVEMRPDHLAYISFTSGSTGTPKGVAVPHRAVLRLVHGEVFARFGPDEVFLLMAPIAFDASTLELWGPLLHGGRLAIMAPGTPTLEQIGQTVKAQEVTTLWLTAGLFNLMVDERVEDLRGVRQLLSGGDVLSPRHVAQALAALPHTRLINGYGPTENTTFTCCHRILTSDLNHGSIPIGRPISHTTVAVLDDSLRPVPIGAVGELYTGGDGLARGYIGQPELTAAAFVPHPQLPGARLYRTGDRVRWRGDGTLEFIGRADRQVKINGHRIEPGEVEAALAALAGVHAAAVMVDQGSARKRLIGYAASTNDAETLRAALAEHLPDYLVPPVIVTLPALPLTPNGKVDRQALPPPPTNEELETVAPRNEVERVVAEIWGGVLALERIGIHANYFASGGDSIGAIQVASRLRRAGWTIRVADLFQHPTVASLAAYLDRNVSTTAPTPRSAHVGPVAPTPAQAWFLQHFTTARHHFNQAVLLQPRTAWNDTKIARAVTAVWRHHDALRTVLRGDVLEILPPSHPCELVCITVPDDAARLAHTETIQRGFDLADGPLFQAVHYRLPGRERLLLVAHHLAVDGVSWRLIIEDLTSAMAMDAPELGPRPLNIHRWSTAVAEQAHDHLLYWRSVLARPVAPWPAPRSDTPNRFGNTSTIGTRLSEATTRSLLTEVHAAFHTEVDDFLLLALGRALQRWHGGATTRVMLEGHGRDARADIPPPEHTVGWFTALHPFVLEIVEGDLARQLKSLKEARRLVPEHGNTFGPSAFLSNATELSTATAEIPISFNYLGRFDDEAESELRFAEESSGSPIGSDVTRPHEIDAGAAVTGGCLGLSLTFGVERVNADAMQTLLDDWAEELDALIRFTTSDIAPEATPADFTSPVFQLPEYESFLQRHGWSATAVEDVARLSPMQAGLLFQSVFDETSSAYFVQMAYRLRGTLDASAFVAAWHELARRHTILRTSFVHEDTPEPVQIIWRERVPVTAVHDLRHLDADEQRTHIAASRQEDLARPFDLAHDALWRVTIWQLADDLTEIVWSYHHVLLDGWSLGLVHRDLFACYAGNSKLEPSIPYRDYVRWLEQRPPEAARNFWSSYLNGYDDASPLPAEPTSTITPEHHEYSVELGESLSQQLRKLATDTGSTLATLMQAAWGILLGRLNRTEDVVFGAIVSGRPADLAGVERMVGLFICAVPVRITCGDDRSFGDLLKTAQRDALTAEPHHHLPLPEIQTFTPLGRKLFDHLLVFENFPIDRTTTGGSAAAPVIEHVEAHDRTHYDFDLTIDPGTSISLRFGHDRAVYGDDQIARLAARFETLLVGLVANPQQAIGSISCLPQAEHERVTITFNQTGTAVPNQATLVTLLQKGRSDHPHALAVVQGDTALTYEELHLRADALAEQLQARGVKPETVVGLSVGRTPDMIIGVLGIMRAGGAYLPLDPLYPAERLRGMLADAGARIVVTTRTDAQALPVDAKTMEVLHLEEVPVQPEQDLSPVTLQPHHLAYLIYTSGSTGRPKGVAVEHRSLVNAAVAWREGYGLNAPGAAPRILQMASLSFDVFAGDLIRALTNGGTLYLCDADTRLDPEGLVALLREHRITQFESTPGLILPLMEHARHTNTDLPDLGMLILGSDTLRAADYRRLVTDFGQGRRIINSYGVTEATIDTCFYENASPPESRGDESTPIGCPMANQRLYVLDSRGQPAGIGVPGELFIGGDGLARGYHARDELTAERFPTLDPGDGKQRLYRAGDLACWRADGRLEFLGRSDRQVKVRGVRIEPGEIESNLRHLPSVADALVEARDMGGNLELVAYVVPKYAEANPVAACRDHLRSTLSAAMLPGHWVVLDRLPLSPNGKVDRRALPDPDPALAAPSEDKIAPRTATEVTIAKLWQDVLQVSLIGVDDDFFLQGGHSLKAMQLLSRIQRDLGVRVPMRTFFDHATIAGLATQVDANRRPNTAESGDRQIPLAAPAPHYPLSYAQQRLWLLHQLGGETAYNMPEAYRVDGPLDPTALEQAIARVIQRHEALRTEFTEIEGDPVQRIHADVPYTLNRVDLRDSSDAESEARSIADREAVAPFDLKTPPLLRTTLLQLKDDRWVYLQTIHHIVGDGWSGNVLYREIFAAYAAAMSGATPPLPALRLHYKDFACWQKARGWDREESYWLHALRGAPSALALPYDFPSTTERDFRGDHEKHTLGAVATAALRRRATERRTTVANTLLAVFDLLLFQLTQQPDFCIGVSHANRHHPDLENLLGFFVNLLPVRARLDASMDFDALLNQVVETADAALEHQEYPFDLMVQQLNPDRAANRQPLLNIVYAFQNFADVHVDIGVPLPSNTPSPNGPEITPFDHTFHTSKFDLTLFASDDGDTIELVLEYDAGLFKAATIRRYLSLLDRFADMIGSTPNS